MPLELRTSCRYGRFNLMNPDEKSWSCHVAIWDGETRVMSCNFTPENEIRSDQNPSVLLMALQDEMAIYTGHWHGTSSDETKAVLAFIAEHEDELRAGLAEKRIALLRLRKSNIETEIVDLTRFVAAPPATGAAAS
jgi:hypothetical protein